VSRLLTETDGPFVKIDGRPVRPRDVATTVDDLASLLGSSGIEVRAQIGGNLRTLLEELSGPKSLRADPLP
jgi:TatD DNase family protein